MPIKDNEHIYDTKIAPLVDHIITLCKDNGIPFLMTSTPGSHSHV